MESRSLFETFQLAWVNKIVQDQRELEMFADDLLNEFS